VELTDEVRAALGVALNEATLLGVEVDSQTRRAAVTFAVLSLPEEGSSRGDVRVQFVFESVGRVAASLRLGRWDDPAATVESFDLPALLSKVRSFDGLPIYGWDFFDIAEKTFPILRNRLSVDVEFIAGECSHSLTLFQECPDRHLDLWLWFGDFTIKDADGKVVPLEEFTIGGARWWQAFNDGDPRTQGRGMYPLS
jgi:hypothetical protein